MWIERGAALRVITAFFDPERDAVHRSLLEQVLVLLYEEAVSVRREVEGVTATLISCATPCTHHLVDFPSKHGVTRDPRGGDDLTVEAGADLREGFVNCRKEAEDRNYQVPHVHDGKLPIL